MKGHLKILVCASRRETLFSKRESCVQKGIHWDDLELIVLTWLHLDSLETICFAAVLRPSGENGTGEQAQGNHGKPRQTISELTRSGQNTSRKHHRDSTISQNNFPFHFATQVKHQSQGHGRAARRTNLTLNPQRQDHARRKDLDFPVGLTPQPPMVQVMANQNGNPFKTGN